MTNNPYLSIVVPVKDEEENIAIFYDEITKVLSSINHPFEIVFVNDGSIDETENILVDLAKKDLRIHLISFRRNYGQTAAMNAGFRVARGEVIVAMDADLQNDAKDIPLLLSKINEGFDLVSDWRKNRKDKMITRRIPSIAANWLIGKFLRVQLHDYGCSLKAYKREILKDIYLYGEMHRFIPAYAAHVGARITEVEVNHRPRIRGKTKYGISRTTRVFLDMLTVKFIIRFSSKPMHLFGTPGLLLLFSGFAILSYLAGLKIFLGASIADRPLLSLGVLCSILGVQFVSLGLLAEIIVRTHFEASSKFPYFIKNEIEGGVSKN